MEESRQGGQNQMSIPRYKPNPLWFGMPILDAKDGKLCEYRDYVKLKAQVERLTKAGDYMASHLEWEFGANPSTDAWHAAKEGKQP
jgi:hypothetical protein